MDAFADAIAHDRIPLTPGEAGLQDIRVMEAIYQPAASGSVITMAPADGLDITRGPLPHQNASGLPSPALASRETEVSVFFF